MNNRQIRYESEAEIIAIIDESTRAMKAAEQAGLLHRRMADKFTKDSAKHTNGDAAILIDRADDELRKEAFMVRRASRISEKLRKLKEALAAFRTGSFPFNTDHSVVVDK